MKIHGRTNAWHTQVKLNSANAEIETMEPTERDVGKGTVYNLHRRGLEKMVEEYEKQD